MRSARCQAATLRPVSATAHAAVPRSAHASGAFGSATTDGDERLARRDEVVPIVRGNAQRRTRAGAADQHPARCAVATPRAEQRDHDGARSPRRARDLRLAGAPRRPPRDKIHGARRRTRSAARRLARTLPRRDSRSSRSASVRQLGRHTAATQRARQRGGTREALRLEAQSFGERRRVSASHVARGRVRRVAREGLESRGTIDRRERRGAAPATPRAERERWQRSEREKRPEHRMLVQRRARRAAISRAEREQRLALHRVGGRQRARIHVHVLDCRWSPSRSVAIPG